MIVSKLRYIGVALVTLTVGTPGHRNIACKPSQLVCASPGELNERRHLIFSSLFDGDPQSNLGIGWLDVARMSGSSVHGHVVLVESSVMFRVSPLLKIPGFKFSDNPAA